MKRKNISSKGSMLALAAIITVTAAGLCSLPVHAAIDVQAAVPSAVSTTRIAQNQFPAASNSDVNDLSSQTTTDQNTSQSVKLTAEAARNSLAKQPQFKSWVNADLTYSPLGPGMHSWLVLVQKAGKSAGYMIITGNKDASFTLNEYGAGSHPPFSINVLQPVLRAVAETFHTTVGNIQVVPVYEQPALAYWTLQSPAVQYPLYIDAFTGQDLPLGEPGWRNKLKRVIGAGGTASPLTDTALTVTDSIPTDMSPYTDLAWLKQQPLALHNSCEWAAALQENTSMKMIYNAHGLNYVFHSPFTVNGYESWSSGNYTTAGNLYVRTEYADQATRYLPLSHLIRAGAFYTIKD